LKRQRNSKESAYFIILKKLLLTKDILERKDFEIPKVKDTIIEKGKTSTEEYVPHSTLILRLEELKKIEAIKEMDSGRMSKKDLPIRSYYLTFFGIIKLLQICDEKKFNSDIFHNLESLSFISVKLLSEVFSKKQIFETLMHVCKNTRIKIVHNPKNFIDDDFFIRYTAADMLNGKHGTKIYLLKIKRDYLNFSYVIDEQITIHGIKKRGKIVFSTAKAIVPFNKTVSCAFYDELIQRCIHKNGYPKKHTRNSAIVWLCEYIKWAIPLNDNFLNYLEKLTRQFEDQSKYITNISQAVNGKKSARTKLLKM